MNGVKELYDLENDPMELVDASSRLKNAGVINTLMEELLKWCIRTETDYPSVKTIHA